MSIRSIQGVKNIIHSTACMSTLLIHIFLDVVEVAFDTGLWMLELNEMFKSFTHSGEEFNTVVLFLHPHFIGICVQNVLK